VLVEDYGVGMSAMLLPEGGGEPISVMAMEKIKSESGLASGSFALPKKGTLVVTFDNSYSLLRSLAFYICVPYFQYHIFMPYMYALQRLTALYICRLNVCMPYTGRACSGQRLSTNVYPIFKIFMPYMYISYASGQKLSTTRLT